MMSSAALYLSARCDVPSCGHQEPLMEFEFAELLAKELGVTMGDLEHTVRWVLVARSWGVTWVRDRAYLACPCCMREHGVDALKLVEDEERRRGAVEEAARG